MQLNKKMLEAIVLYAVHDQSFTKVMDELSVSVTDAQWETLTSALEWVDVVIGKTDKASLRQREAYAAHSENRKSEYPSILSIQAGYEKALRKISELEQKHGIKSEL